MYTTVAKIQSIVTTSLDVESYIKAVSTFIDRYVGYKLGALGSTTPKSLYFDGTGTDTICLNRFVLKTPLLEVWEGGIQRTDVKFYPLNEDAGEMVTADRRFIVGNGNIEVKNCIVARYTVDWTIPANHTLPDDITFACNELVIAMIKSNMANSGANSGVIKSETIGAYSLTYEDVNKVVASGNLSAIESINILKNYKLPVIF